MGGDGNDTIDGGLGDDTAILVTQAVMTRNRWHWFGRY